MKSTPTTRPVEGVDVVRHLIVGRTTFVRPPLADAKADGDVSQADRRHIHQFSGIRGEDSTPTADSRLPWCRGQAECATATHARPELSERLVDESGDEFQQTAYRLTAAGSTGRYGRRLVNLRAPDRPYAGALTLTEYLTGNGVIGARPATCQPTVDAGRLISPPSGPADRLLLTRGRRVRHDGTVDEHPGRSALCRRLR